MSKKPEEPKREEIILYRSMDEVMHDSMIPYAEHVILERALPRVEDGLKPVQRRILYTMLELGLSPDKPHRKSARIVGDCLGKYHPHGDSSVYEAMVHMAQPFAMSLPLVDGHGNFGSIDGDSAAAMRYTEARMTDAAMQILRDIDLDTVDWSLNFDDTLKEPDLLPGRFPNLLINGASGIAVGLATNIPPHNPGEAIDAAVAMIDDPRISLKKLMEIMPAPDFPTGGYLIDSPEIAAAYETGRGKLTMRAKTHFEQQKNGKTLIVITEIPYGINKAAALQKILTVTQEKKAMFAGVADIRDESDRQGMRAVVEVKKDADPEKILQALFKYSDLQCTFGVNMTAIAEGKPQQLDLKSILRYFINHQKNVVTRRTKCELETARHREHILEGLMVAVDHVDAVIKLIRGSKSPKEAKEKLMAKYSLSEVQAQAILDLRLQRLTNLELVAIEKEYHDVQKRIAELEGILASERKLMTLIKKELLEIKKLFPIPRRTQIVKGDTRIELSDENQVVTEEMAVAFCADLKVRKWPSRLFTLGEISADKPWRVVKLMGDQKLRLFTDRGDMLMLNVSDIPETRPTARAVSLTSLLAFEKNEQIVAVFPEDAEGDYLFYTAGGAVKRTPCAEYSIRAKRTAALNLKDKDKLIGVEKANGLSLLLVTEKGMSIRFAAEEVPGMGRVSSGVRGVKLEDGDRVIYAGQTDDEGELALVTDRGFSKRSFLFEYEPQGRGGKGLKTFDFNKRGSNGTRLVWARPVKEPYDIVIVQRRSPETPLNTEQLRLEDRFSKGTMAVTVLLDDDVVAVRPVLSGKI
ncbi:MAG: DNA topoisomerase 4 subunit A [Clostridia bacterium]|nr:DNA topoisomerase 4 subunit A [Clostridia bacterium]